MARKCDETSTFKRFAECAVTMRDILYNDSTLSEAEFLFMDKHFQVLEMAYLRWKQKQAPHLSEAGKGTVQSKGG